MSQHMNYGESSRQPRFLSPSPNSDKGRGMPAAVIPMENGKLLGGREKENGRDQSGAAAAEGDMGEKGILGGGHDGRNGLAGKPKRGKKKRPWGLKWRTAPWYMTTVVAFGIATDALAYNVVVPVLPFRLQALGYTGVSGWTSWLFFSYSMGIFVLSFPGAWFFDRYTKRRLPLVVAVLFAVGSMIMFMLATPYWVLVLSRFIMGAASTVVWTVGFALLCENVPEKNIGRQIGFATSGLAVGSTIAPPIGGALYWNMGWHAPSIFAIACLLVDLVGRLLVIERRDLELYDIDPEAEGINIALSASREETEDHATTHHAEEGTSIQVPLPSATKANESALTLSPNLPVPGGKRSSHGEVPIIAQAQVQSDASVDIEKPKKLSPWGVLVALGSSPRGMNGFLLTLIYGLVLGMEDPTLTLRIQSVWHKNSTFVGIVYLLATVPTFVTGPIVGHFADKHGSEWVIAPSLLLVLPWFPLMIMTKSLPGFVVFFALSNTLLSIAFGPIGLELAIAAKLKEGISEIHQFAAMNVAFSVTTCIGAVAGGQLYDRYADGWNIVMWILFGAVAASVIVPFCLAGNKPLLQRIRGRSTGKTEGRGRSAGPVEPPDTVSTGGVITTG